LVNKLRQKSEQDMCPACGRRHLLARFWWENEKRRDHLEDPGIVGMIILKCILKK
jgi:hypothetical protein